MKKILLAGLILFGSTAWGQVITPDKLDLNAIRESLSRFQQSDNAKATVKDFQQPDVPGKPPEKKTVCSSCGEESHYSRGQIFYFISASMPEESLRVSLARAVAINKESPDKVLCVMKGLVENNLKATIKKFYSLIEGSHELKSQNLPIAIDPTLFTKYGIERVPVLVIDSDEGTGIVRGDVSLEWAISRAEKLEDSGKVGNTYEVAEMDMAEFLASKQASIEADVKSRAREMIRKAHSLDRFKGAYKVASEEKTYYIDPTYVVKEDIKDPNTGKVIIPAGKRINPSQFGPLQKGIIIDADDDRQIEFTLREAADVQTVILINGDAVEASKKIGKRVFLADETIIERLKIARVPLIYEQSGEMIRVQEKALN